MKSLWGNVSPLHGFLRHPRAIEDADDLIVVPLSGKYT